MSAHTHRELVDGCYRCDLNRDELEANREEDERDAQAAWIEYRDSYMRRVGLERGRRHLRKREFIAGFLAGRTY